MKNEIEIKARKYYLYIAITIVTIWIFAVIVSYTPLVQNYWINFVVLIIIQNTVNLIFIIIILSILYIIEKKIIEQKINNYERRVNKHK